MDDYSQNTKIYYSKEIFKRLITKSRKFRLNLITIYDQIRQSKSFKNNYKNSLTNVKILENLPEEI